MLYFLFHAGIHFSTKLLLLQYVFTVCSGSVLHVVHNYYPYGLPEKAIAQVLKNILLAVQYLHDQKIVHRLIFLYTYRNFL